MQNKISFAGAVAKTFKSWRVYRGVASRTEYWYFVLFNFLLGLVAGTIDNVIQAGQTMPSVLSVGNMVSLLLLPITTALLVRRFRDAGLSGFWLLTQLAAPLLTLLKLSAIISFIEGPFTKIVRLVDSNRDIPDAQAQLFLGQFFDAFGLIILVVLAVGVFQFVVTLLPTKPSWRGNKYAPKTEGEPTWGYSQVWGYQPVWGYTVNGVFHPVDPSQGPAPTPEHIQPNQTQTPPSDDSGSK